MTNQQGAPEALTLAGAVDHWARGDYGLRGDEMRKAAAELRRLHYENERLAARAPADSVTAPAGEVGGDVDAIALSRYKVVSAHESMFHRFAVVAGDGKQQLYLGREVECENMARKFAGAFLDGAFYQANIAPTPPAQAADSVLEDAARLDWLALAGPVSICVVIDRPHDGEVEVATDDVTGYGKTLREALDAARKQGGA